MVDLKLENDEGIIQQANSVEVYKANDVYEEIYEMYLTNKNIICYYEKSNGLFAKSEEIIEKIPLQSIRIVNDKLQISKVDNDEYGLGLQILLQNGERAHFVFDKKKELQIWYDAILETITGKKSESNTTNESLKKENAIVGSFLGVVKTVKDIAKDQIDEVKEQINDVKDMFIDEEEVNTTSNNKIEVKQEEIENNLSKNKKEKVKESMNSEKEKSFYCRNCGEKLMPNSKFCNYCGTPTEDTIDKKNVVEEKKNETSREELTERKMVYDGKIHKCPNCGEVLNSFVTNCPACGYELRDSKNSSAVEELSRKLEEIEQNRDRTKVSTKILGAFNLSDGLTKTDEQKISLIRNFPIPNTKEDLYEFLILSKSNIEIDLYENTQIKSARLAISDAWKAKFEQAYQKAKLLLKNDDRMIEIDAMYKEINHSINKAKRKTWVILGVVFGILVVMYASIFGIIGLTGGFSSDKSKSNNSNSESVSIVENKDTTKQENNKETKTEQKSSVSLGDNIVVNNNEYVEIKEVGYTRSSSYLTCVVTISNSSQKAIEYPSFRVTAYDKDGKILGSEERVLSLLYPNHIMVDEGTLIKMSEEPDKIEVTMLEPDDYKIKDVSTLEHPQYNEMKCQNISVNSDKVTGEVYNPNDYKMEQAKITIVFRDDNNKIINSESTFVDNIPANGKVPFDISLPSDAKVTDKIEATACIW